MIKRHMVGIALATALALAAGSAWSASNDCGRVGTWFGATPGGFSWLGTDTPGMSATTGQMSLEWVAVPATLFIAGANHVTGAKGIWQKIKQGEYEFSWTAYGVNTNPPQTPIYRLRVSGSVTHTDCNNANISYTIELFIPPSASIPFQTITDGTGTETRMLLP